MKNVIDKMKKNKMILFIILGIILIIILILIFARKKDKFVLNEIYNFYPEEVRGLYANLVNVNCSGDLHLNIELDGGAKRVTDMDKEDLLNYMFSNLEKEDKLKDKFDIALINDAQKRLFNGDVSLFDEIGTYNYGNYEYRIDGRTITRKVRKCTSDNTYVLHLYGYSDNKKDRLSIDVNVSYLKDGILYDYHNNELGEYDGDVTKLPKLTENTTYYRLTYYRGKGTLKLDSVEHKSRT